MKHECGCPLLRAIVYTAAVPLGIVVLVKQPFDWFTGLMFASIVAVAVSEWVTVARERRAVGEDRP